MKNNVSCKVKAEQIYFQSRKTVKMVITRHYQNGKPPHCPCFQNELFNKPDYNKAEKLTIVQK